jgi:hypothetical protein
MSDDWETWKIGVIKETLAGDSPVKPVNGEQAGWLIHAVLKACPQLISFSLNGTAHLNRLPEVEAPVGQLGQGGELAASREPAKPIQHDPERHPVDHPPYYTQGKVECIDAIEAALGPQQFIGFLRGQVLRYTWRMGGKDAALREAAKANWYGRLLEAKLKEGSTCVAS